MKDFNLDDPIDNKFPIKIAKLNFYHLIPMYGERNINGCY